MTFEADIERVLFSENEIRARIDQLASELTRAYADRDFTVVSVLKGSCVFVADLIRRIPIPLELAFVAASSYRDGTESGALDVIFPAGNEIQGRDVLLVDDILDTGRTLKRLRDEITERGAREVKTCVFLDKPARRTVPLQADFRGFVVEDLFVVGYGLDFAGRYRNLPYVGALRESVFQAAGARRGAAPRA
jgi:hypoxanthine phosphoribosyltransferase